MRPLGWLPRWLQRAIEAALVAGLLGIVSTVAAAPHLAGGDVVPRLGLVGSLLLIPPVLALAVIATAYPVALAATRSEALLGAIGSSLLVADALVLLVPTPVLLESLERQVPIGALAGGLGLASGLVGIIAGQAGTRLGFGRRAGAVTSVAAAVAGVVVSLAVASVA